MALTKENLRQAQAAIDREDVEVLDLCADMGQLFDNIKDMRWFLVYVARELYAN